MLEAFMRLLPTIGAVAVMLGTQAMAQPGTRLVWQPVQEYFIHRDETQQVKAGTKRLNSFTSYTHLGSDFGFHGPAEHELDWLTDEIVAHLGQQPDGWAGMWHSLAGQLRNEKRVMDFTRAYPEPITAKHQPRVSAVMIEAAGRGKIKLEIKSPAQELRWTQMIELNEPQYRMFVHPVAPEAVRDGKTLVWTAEPGAEVKVSGLFLGVEMPQMPGMPMRSSLRMRRSRAAIPSTPASCATVRTLRKARSSPSPPPACMSWPPPPRRRSRSVW
jgi:hypothetical protein